MIEVEDILEASRPEDVFGYEPDEAAIGAAYHGILKRVHPDVSGHEWAGIATARLNRLYESALARIGTRTYGGDETTVSSRRHEYHVASDFVRGSLCNVFRATTAEGTDVVIKVSRAADGDGLLAAEYRIVGDVLREAHERDIYDALSPYVPTPFERLSVSGRQASAWALTDGLYTLEQIRARYPDGVGPRDLVWMFRRCLVALSNLHSLGRVHGALLPPHVLIYGRPDDHGAQFVDWKASVEDGDRLPVTYRRWSSYYPDGAADGFSYDHDLRMLARSMRYLCGDRMPVQIRAFINGSDVHALPTAAELHHELGELAERLWGERVYNPFTMEDA